MRNIFVVLFSIIIGANAIAEAEQIDGDVDDSKTQAYLLEYVEDCKLSDEEGVATIYHGDSWRLTSQGEASLDMVGGLINVPDSEFVYKLIGYAPIGIQSRDRMYLQKLVIGEEHLHRYGFGNVDDHFVVRSDVVDGSLKGKSREDAIEEWKRKTKAPIKWFSPFAAVTCGLGDVELFSVTSAYVRSLYVDSARFLKSQRDAEGRLVGTWRVGRAKTTLVEITFDHKQGNRPIQTVMKRVGKDVREIDKISELPVFSVTEATWFKATGNARWLPKEVRMTSFDRKLGRPTGGVDMSLEWKFGKEVTTHLGPVDRFLPVPEVDLRDRDDLLDWREPLRIMFSEDWALSHDDRKLEKLMR